MLCLGLQTLRTLGVWMLSLFVYYVLKWQGPDSAGEPWTVFSWYDRGFCGPTSDQCADIDTSYVSDARLELVGFLLMVYGTLAVSR